MLRGKKKVFLPTASMRKLNLMGALLFIERVFVAWPCISTTWTIESCATRIDSLSNGVTHTTSIASRFGKTVAKPEKEKKVILPILKNHSILKYVAPSISSGTLPSSRKASVAVKRTTLRRKSDEYPLRTPTHRSFYRKRNKILKIDKGINKHTGYSMSGLINISNSVSGCGKRHS